MFDYHPLGAAFFGGFQHIDEVKLAVAQGTVLESLALIPAFVFLADQRIHIAARRSDVILEVHDFADALVLS